MNLLKRLLLFSIMLVLTLSITFDVHANEGMAAVKSTDTEQIFWYIGEDGYFITNQWKQVWGYWYYFGEDGKSLQNSWFQDANGNWYYFNEYSIMLTDTTTPDGYYVGADGICTNKMDESIDVFELWSGIYKDKIGQTITLRSVNSGSINITFEGYGKDGWSEQGYVLILSSDKKQGIFENEHEGIKDVYTLTDTGIEISTNPGGYRQGTYIKQ